jgi:hypothetical protein
MPAAQRGFRVPLYPYTPVFAIGGCIVLAFYLNINAVMIASGFILIGLLVYRLTTRHEAKEAV